jgi:hypothetical protein
MTISSAARRVYEAIADLRQHFTAAHIAALPKAKRERLDQALLTLDRELNHVQPIRAVLDESGFRLIVAGKVGQLQTYDGTRVDFILSDIGYDRMQQAIDDAEATDIRWSKPGKT